MNLNLANKVTLARMSAVPFIIFFMYIDNFWARIAALLIFSVAAITDTVDGMLARKYGYVTTLGKFLDPLADKLLVSAALVSFVGLREIHIPSWMVVLIISREFIISGLRSLAASKDVIIAAHKSGKFKTTSQMVAIITTMSILVINSALYRYYGIRAAELLNSSGFTYFIGWFLIKFPYWLMLAATITTIYSGLAYLNRHKDLLKES
jgi:CDP-diacylglycerol--glycerol-3-phosphate 3-phosphatidyltransferase